MDAMMAPPPFDELEDRILPWSQVKIICGLSRTTVWRLQKSGDFPACVQVSLNRVGWWQSELLAWKRARTPRRLPEPPQILQRAETAVEVDHVERTHTPSPISEPPNERATPARAGRRKRKTVVPENQTMFDFGG